MSPAQNLSQPFCHLEFFGQLAEPLALLELYDCLPGIYMYVKDRQGRYMHVNQVVCEVMGGKAPHEVLGKTDFDFFPPAIASQYIAEDQRVIQSGSLLKEQVWLVPGAGGVPQWYLCNKIPLFDRRRRIIGIAGVKRPYGQAGNAPPDYLRLLKVTEFVTTHFRRPISMQELAEQIDLSVSQLQREFKRLFSLSPSQYLQEVRVGGHDDSWNQETTALQASPHSAVSTIKVISQSSSKLLSECPRWLIVVDLLRLWDMGVCLPSEGNFLAGL